MTNKEYEKVCKILDQHKHPIYLSNGLPIIVIGNSEVEKLKLEIKEMVKWK